MPVNSVTVSGKCWRKISIQHIRTVTRFRDVTDVTGDIYQLFCRGIAVPQINVEIGVPLVKTPSIISRIKQWYAESRPHMQYPIILLCTSASSAWLSPAFDHPTCFFGFVVYVKACPGHVKALFHKITRLLK